MFFYSCYYQAPKNKFNIRPEDFKHSTPQGAHIRSNYNITYMITYEKIYTSVLKSGWGPIFCGLKLGRKLICKHALARKVQLRCINAWLQFCNYIGIQECKVSNWERHCKCIGHKVENAFFDRLHVFHFMPP